MKKKKLIIDKYKKHTLLENIQLVYVYFIYIIHPLLQDQVQPNGLF